MIIYLITNKVTGKQYVGQTTRSVKNRWKEHCESKTCIGNAIKKYGKKSFSKKVIEQCKSLNKLDKKEVHWIKELNTIAPNGYNLTEGGNGNLGYVASKETRKKMSESRMGIKMSKETCKRMSESHKGIALSKDHRKRIGLSQIGRIGWNKGVPRSETTKKKISQANSGKGNAMYGKNFSKEHRRKMSEAKKGRTHSKETKRKMSESAKKAWEVRNSDI